MRMQRIDTMCTAYIINYAPHVHLHKIIYNIQYTHESYRYASTYMAIRSILPDIIFRNARVSIRRYGVIFGLGHHIQ